LPFASENIEQKLAALPDEFDKSLFIEWVTDLQMEYMRHANVFECYDEKDELVKCATFRIIESVWCDELGPPPQNPPQLIRA
jgi:hypothetical protein